MDVYGGFFTLLSSEEKTKIQKERGWRFVEDADYAAYMESALDYLDEE
ncbi:MAG: hypothetical protein JXR96_09935 [Deltaproteobacteria bacterium]|nr:hypothetical protein [Deltaproteobacteria bacterium]